MNTKDTVKAVLKRFSGRDNIISVNREYIQLCDGDFPAALMLSQIIYWTDRTNDPDGWIAKSAKDWKKELCLSPYQVSRAAKTLKPLGVETKRARSKYHGGGSTLHYRIDMDVLVEAITGKLDNQETQEADFEGARKSVSQETQETYTSTTTPTTTSKKKSAPNGTEQATPPANSAKDKKPDKPGSGAAVNAMITAWVEAQGLAPSKRHYANKTDRKYFEELLDAGYTADNVRAYVEHLRRSVFWQDKFINARYISDGLPLWKQAQHTAEQSKPRKLGVADTPGAYYDSVQAVLDELEGQMR